MSKYSSCSLDELNTAKALSELQTFVNTGDLNSLDRARLMAALAQNYALESKMISVVKADDKLTAAQNLLKETV